MMKNNLLHPLKGKGLWCISILSFGFMLFSFSSCKVTSQSAYFKTLKKDTTLKGFFSNDFEAKIIKGDRLSITVSSLSPVEDAIFNAAGTSGSSSTDAGGYTVQQDGTVLLHRLGAIAAEGFTRKELSKKIQNSLTAYTKEPIVSVAFLNHKITILGEVGQPQVLKMPEEQISIIDALVLSGDVTTKAKRNDITIIREEGNEKKVKHLNLEDHSIFSSPWYYVKPNDIIIVSADNEKFVKEEKRQKLQTTLSLVASGVSLVIIIISQIFK
jgi:polysaccharide biosynthesis/export protein